MHSIFNIFLVFFIVCAVNASVFNNDQSEEKNALAVINDQVIAESAAVADDLTSEGQSTDVVIRAKRYYGCGCGCCGCGTMAPATAMPCGCGCCGCGFG